MMKTFPDFPGSRPSEKLSISNPSHTEIPVQKNHLRLLIETVEKTEGVRFLYIELVYVGEEQIVEINKEYLGKDYVTDIITFRYDEHNTQAIEGTLFCCAPRITEQSLEMSVDEPENEFYRVFIHGLLHLAGYEDDTAENKKEMTRLEDHCLEVLRAG